MDGWTADESYKEMKQYDFYTAWGHGCYKNYVYDYFRDASRQASRQIQATSEAQSKSRTQGNEPDYDEN